MAAGQSGPVVIAVSGGSDSLALLLLSVEWARKAARSILVLTVDHGRRPEAAGEARHVAEIAGRLGCDAQILTLDGQAGSQDAMRRARHAGLARAARDAGGSLLLLGHTLSDAEETFLMRLRRGSGLIGAAAPQPVSVSPVWPDGRGLMLGRPLLDVRRDQLQAWLRGNGETWASDPGNLSETYERVRMRKLIAALPQGNALEGIYRDAVRLRALSDAALAVDLDACVSVDPAGLVTLANWPSEAARLKRLMSVTLQAAAGTDVRADSQKLDTVLTGLLSNEMPSRVTLGGAWLQLRGDRLLIGRDPGEAKHAWKQGVWDGRYARTPQGSSDVEPAFLVRHAVPDGDAWREIISERLATWSRALKLSAGLSGALGAGEGVDMFTTRPG